MHILCPCISAVSNNTINSPNMSNQTGLNRDKAKIKLIQHYFHTYSCQVLNVLWTLIGCCLTSKSVWAIAVDLCTEMFTSTHFLFPWALLPCHSSWLIVKPRLGKGSCPSSQCLLHLGYLICNSDWLNGYLPTCGYE